MIKTITFGEKDVRFSTAFAWTFTYKSQFGHDPMKLLIPAIRRIDQLPEGATSEDQAYILFEDLGVTGIVQIAWAMAKLCDPSIPDPLGWVDLLGEDLDVGALIGELVVDAIQSCFSTKKSNAPIPTKD